MLRVLLCLGSGCKPRARCFWVIRAPRSLPYFSGTGYTHEVVGAPRSSRAA